MTCLLGRHHRRQNEGRQATARRSRSSRRRAVRGEPTPACGKKITAKGPGIKSYSKAGGHYAYGKLPKKTGLFEPKPTNVKVGGKKVKAKIMVLFDSSKLAQTIKIEIGKSYSLDFFARK